PPPPPSMLRQPRRTLVEMAAAAYPNLDADWDDPKEDAVTDVFAERATLVFERGGVGDDESTHEIPRPTLRRLPADAPAAAGPVSLPPLGFDVLSASLAAASLAPPGFTAALARSSERANETSTPPPPLGV